MLRAGYYATYVCEKCGEEDTLFASPEATASAWIKGEGVHHSNPDTCINNLRRKIEKLKIELKAAKDHESF